ncbi:GNAT family N-acetyltransferase [Nocardiopsis kunsanensis]|uniref:Lysine N-acyltransferase MbtK n=1 Tax=Nocardiopsis kunsanensis TaxID=141693 RepID=A0A918XIL9_9ACTN|nr:GNAT family N-acetyltransferase [Nocardiopsis kunsanensis]GHD33863.1 acetyltransferase [Nocardiopsis kunsanensis]
MSGTTNDTTVLTREDPLLGRFTVRPLEPESDLPMLHRWLTDPKSEFWLLTEASQEEVARQFRATVASEHEWAYIGEWEGEPRFLAELYDPAHSELKDVYTVRPGDTGMHFLVAPTDTPVPGFTRSVITTVMELAFADPGTDRVVVEPDVRNRPVHVLNTAMGFHVERTVSLGEKEAHLGFCSRDQFAAATAAGTTTGGDRR